MIDSHDELCWYCGKRCSSLAGNPGIWPLLLPLDETNPGHCVAVHTGCVLNRLKRCDAEIRKATVEASSRDGKPNVLRATGWAMLDSKGTILLGSIRARPDETRLAAGEGRVYQVTVFLEMDQR